MCSTTSSPTPSNIRPKAGKSSSPPPAPRIIAWNSAFRPGPRHSPKEYQSRIFDRFFRAPGQSKPGAGLGLSIAREITIAHGAASASKASPGYGQHLLGRIKNRGCPSVRGGPRARATATGGVRFRGRRVAGNGLSRTRPKAQPCLLPKLCFCVLCVFCGQSFESVVPAEHAEHAERCFEGPLRWPYNSSKNSASLRILTPSSRAFSSLEPASAPARTKSVFLLTLPVTFPPRDSIFTVASSRVSMGSVPVRTNVLPANFSAAATAALTCSLCGLMPRPGMRARTFFPAPKQNTPARWTPPPARPPAAWFSNRRPPVAIQFPRSAI